MAVPDGVWTEREGFLMGTRLHVRVLGADRAAGLAASEAVLEEVRRLEDVLSTWREDTELAVVNRAPVGRPQAVAEPLYGLLSEVRDLAADLGGAFDPAVGPLIDAWDLRGEGRRPGAARLEAARAASGLDRFRLEDGRRTVTRLDGAAWLDSGGFGKGAALRAAEAVLRRCGVERAVLNFGGQLLVVGDAAGSDRTRIPVADPARRTEPAAVLWVPAGSVATTSASERWVESEGERFGHVLDPRTGLPVPAWGSVTVVSADALEADVLSTALFVMGPDAALEWGRARPDVGVLVLDARGEELRVEWSGGLEPYLAAVPSSGDAGSSAGAFGS